MPRGRRSRCPRCKGFKSIKAQLCENCQELAHSIERQRGLIRGGPPAEVERRRAEMEERRFHRVLPSICPSPHPESINGAHFFVLSAEYDKQAHGWWGTCQGCQLVQLTRRYQEEALSWREVPTVPEYSAVP